MDCGPFSAYYECLLRVEKGLPCSWAVGRWAGACARALSKDRSVLRLLLDHSPLTGQPPPDDVRGLIIGRDAEAFVPLYRYVPDLSRSCSCWRYSISARRATGIRSGLQRLAGTSRRLRPSSRGRSPRAGRMAGSQGWARTDTGSPRYTAQAMTSVATTVEEPEPARQWQTVSRIRRVLFRLPPSGCPGGTGISSDLRPEGIVSG